MRALCSVTDRGGLALLMHAETPQRQAEECDLDWWNWACQLPAEKCVPRNMVESWFGNRAASHGSQFRSAGRLQPKRQCRGMNHGDASICKRKSGCVLVVNCCRAAGREPRGPRPIARWRPADDHARRIWPDDRGQHIQAHGGGIIKLGDTFYWFGEDRAQGLDRLRYVSCYSSKDWRTGPFATMSSSRRPGPGIRAPLGSWSGPRSSTTPRRRNS